MKISRTNCIVISSIFLIILILLIFIVLKGAFNASQEYQPNSKYSSIHDAIQANDIYSVKLFIAKDPKSISSYDNHGLMPIHKASFVSNSKAVDLLIAHGADPNFKAKRTNDTSLHFAVMSGDEEVIKILLSHKADASLKNIDGISALDSAREHVYKNVEAVVKLLEYGVEETPQN